MSKAVPLRGPVEKIDGKLILRIPLAAGGDAYQNCTKGISRVEGDLLIITLPDWLAVKMKFREGSILFIDEREGQFHFEVEKY